MAFRLSRDLSKEFTKLFSNNLFVVGLLHTRKNFSSKVGKGLNYCKTLRTSLPAPQMAAFSTSANRKLDLSGVYPPIVTPFEENEEISYSKLEENFQKWNKIPFKGQ